MPRHPPPPSLRLRLRCHVGTAVLVATLGTACASPEGVSRQAPPRTAASSQGDTGASHPDAVTGAAGLDRHMLERIRVETAEMVLTALNSLGVRYRRGGNSEETGFDCSGFTRYVFETSLGLVLPRRVEEQARSRELVVVAREDLQPGDLVFFNTLKRAFSHVGIYIGNNRFIHAPRPGAEVRTEDMSVSYWSRRFTGARRAETTLEAKAAAAPETVDAALARP